MHTATNNNNMKTQKPTHEKLENRLRPNTVAAIAHCGIKATGKENKEKEKRTKKRKKGKEKKNLFNKCERIEN